MKKLTVTYHAPKGDSKVVEIFGHTFYDGKSEEVTVSDDVHKTMSANRFFECGKATDLTDEQAQEEANKAATPQPDHAQNDQGAAKPQPGSQAHPDDKAHHKGR